jgi:hypothetical protein
MGKRDLFLFTDLWFTNRKIDYLDLASGGRFQHVRVSGYSGKQ